MTNVLKVGINSVTAAEVLPPAFACCAYVTTHEYMNSMILWCGKNRLEWDTDMYIQTYRLENCNTNSHRWYFKDPGIATLFSLKFS